MQIKMTGWLKDKYDKRDYPAKGYRYGSARIPDGVDLSALLPPRLDQDGMNGCVGAALRTAIGATAKSLNAYTADYSWLWPWNGARYLEGTLAQNEGVYPRDAFDWVTDKGCLFDQHWPFSGRFDAAAPSGQQMALANKYPDLAYYRVGDGSQGIIESLAESLASWQSGGPAWLVCLGSPWFKLWDNIGRDGALAEVTHESEVSGGHETAIYGFDKTSGRFLVVNSWGERWGNNGLCTLPFSALDVFKDMGGYDAQYLSFKTNSAITGKPGCNPLSRLIKLLAK